MPGNSSAQRELLVLLRPPGCISSTHWSLDVLTALRVEPGSMPEGITITEDQGCVPALPWVGLVEDLTTLTRVASCGVPGQSAVQVTDNFLDCCSNCACASANA